MGSYGQPAVAVQRLVRHFGGRAALTGVDLHVHAGEVRALLGPNGAGKTTLIRILSGLVDPDEGTVAVTGAVGLVPSGDRSFYLRISGLENLVFFGRLHGLRLRSARALAREVLRSVGLAAVEHQPVGRYSHGMQKRLSVARALLVRPTVLLVDEATHDLDPEGARRIRELIRLLASEGTAVIWATQRVEEIREFADTVTFLHRGTVHFAGSVTELIARAPDQRYVLRVRNGKPYRPPDALALQRAVGDLADIASGPGGLDHFLLQPDRVAALGPALGALAEAGFDVLSCRQERAEIEEAFLALAAQEPRR